MALVVRRDEAEYEREQIAVQKGSFFSYAGTGRLPLSAQRQFCFTREYKKRSPCRGKQGLLFKSRFLRGALRGAALGTPIAMWRVPELQGQRGITFWQ